MLLRTAAGVPARRPPPAARRRASLPGETAYHPAMSQRATLTRINHHLLLAAADAAVLALDTADPSARSLYDHITAIADTVVEIHDATTPPPKILSMHHRPTPDPHDG